MYRRISIVGITLIAVTAPLSSAQAASRPAHVAGVSVGDSCLVGTWHDNQGFFSTLWNGQKVKLHGGGGDIDHISADGTDHDNWMHSKPSYGTYQGYRLKETVRGHNLLRFHKVAAHKLRNVELGWSSGSTNKYVYRGSHYTGYLNQSGTSASYYRCNATTLTWTTKKGKVLGTETRLSRTP